MPGRWAGHVAPRAAAGGAVRPAPKASPPDGSPRGSGRKSAERAAAAPPGRHGCPHAQAAAELLGPPGRSHCPRDSANGRGRLSLSKAVHPPEPKARLRGVPRRPPMGAWSSPAGAALAEAPMDFTRLVPGHHPVTAENIPDTLSGPWRKIAPGESQCPGVAPVPVGGVQGPPRVEGLSVACPAPCPRGGHAPDPGCAPPSSACPAP